jgi:hypothetical protein
MNRSASSPPPVRPIPGRRPAPPRHPAGRAERHPTGGPDRHPAGRAERHPAGTPGRRSPASPTRMEELVRAFAQLYLEVEGGRRPPSVARPLLDPRLALQLEGRWVRRWTTPGRVVRVTGRQVAGDAFEGVAVVERGDRTGALAVRLERRRGRWLVVTAERPEDGPLPDPPFTIPDDDADPLEDLLAAATEPTEPAAALTARPPLLPGPPDAAVGAAPTAPDAVPPAALPGAA